MLYFATGILLIALAGFIWLYAEAQSYLNKNLSEFVAKKSHGKYELSFEGLNIKFFSRGIEVNQVAFHPSDSIIHSIDNKTASQQFYSFSSPSVGLRGIDLTKLIFEKKLEVAELIIDQPGLKIHGTENDQESDNRNTLNALLQELKPLVTKTFKSIKFDKIELNHASFDFYNLLGDTHKLANAEDISIGVLNFYTDSVLLPNQDRLFNADDVYLKMHHYQNKLTDSVHVIRAETITYSLKKNVIEAQNIELAPLYQMPTEHDKYFISVPKLRITSGHIKEFYRNAVIPIDSLRLTDAKVKYWPGEVNRKKMTKNEVEFNLYDLIKDEFPGIYIKNFALRNAGLELFNSQSDTISRQKLKQIDIALNDFRLDMAAQSDTSRVFYSGEINLSASDYELILGDNIHRIKVDNLHLSTQNREVLVKNIRIFPDQLTGKLANQKNTIDASCDSIRLDQFDFKKAYHLRRFIFQKINLFNPEVVLTQNEDAKDDSVKENSSFIYNLISLYAKGIYAKQIIVQEGKVQLLNKTGLIQTGNIKSNVRLFLTGFSLDEVSAGQTDRLFFANQIDLNFNNYEMQLVDQLHKLTIENFSLSTRKNRAELNKLHLFPVSKDNMEEMLRKYKRSELYEFTIPHLALSNADFRNAFFNKKLSVDTLAIETPRIYYENFALLKQSKNKADFEDLYGLLSSYLEDIHIGTVRIPDGTILLINHSKKDKTISLNNRFSLTLGNTQINKEQLDQKKLLFSEFVDFSVRDHLIYLSDNVHVLKAGEIGFSTRRKEVYALNARLYPETNSKDFSSINWNIQLAIPEIRIKGVDIARFYFDHKIDADNLTIKAPDIKLYQKRKSDNPKDIKEIALPLPKEIESIALRQFSLNNGSLKIFSELGTKPYLMVQSDISMEAQNIVAQKNLLAGKPEFLSGNYTGKLIQFRFMPKDKNQQFSIDELSFSTKDKKITASELVVKAKTVSQKEDQFELRIPILSLNGFNIDNAYKKFQYAFESITIDRPIFRLFNNAKDTARFNPFGINLYPHFESFADAFTSKLVQVKNADVTVFKNGKKTFQEKFDFSLNNLRIDKGPSPGFMHALGFSFRIPEIKKQSKLYQYSIGESEYSSATNLYTVKNIRISPLYTAPEYQQKVGFQSDYISGKIDSVRIVQPDIRRWFDRKEVVGKSIVAYSPDFDIFRDKRTPFNEDQRQKMFQDLIRSVKTPVYVDSLVLNKAKVAYREQPVNGEEQGRIGFSEIHVQVAPFSNMRKSSGLLSDIALKGSAEIMDSCRLHVAMNFRMNSPENEFTVKGRLSEFNMSILNPVIEPLALVSLRSGHVNRFDFEFSGDKTGSSGQLWFGYDDLKISVLEMKNGSAREAKFTSFLANSLMLRSKNPRGKELLPDEIRFVRDQKRSDLNYWWKSVFSGVRNTLGINRENKSETPQNQ